MKKCLMLGLFIVLFVPVVANSEDCASSLKVGDDPQLLVDCLREMSETFNNIPIGAVVPFFLNPKEILDLNPYWLPADGRTVDDKDSPLFGTNLPDLVDRFPLGTDPNTDVVEGKVNEGGKYTLKVDKITGKVDYVDKKGRTNVVAADGRFTIDTMTDEALSANHNHKFRLSLTLPKPPYRRLVFMVRVR